MVDVNRLVKCLLLPGLPHGWRILKKLANFFKFALLSPLWCFSILVNYYFEAFFNLKVIFRYSKITSNIVTYWLLYNKLMSWHGMFLSLLENVDVTCNEYEILVVATSLADTTGLSLADVGCLPSASDASSASFTITLGQCDTTLTISSDEVKSFYRNKIFQNSTGTTLFNIICSYKRTPKTASGE